MKVDFLIFHSKTDNLMEVFLDSLSKSYEDNYDEPPEFEELHQSITIRYSQEHIQTQEDEDDVEADFICGFSVDFDIADANTAEKLVKDFCQGLAGNDEVVKHVLKLDDPYLREINQKYSDEIFHIEMRLREAISFIFLDTCGNDFYNLLKDLRVKPWGNDPQQEQMQAHWENQFFHLLFSHYPQLNERKPLSKVDDLIQLIGEVDDFESFKQMLTSKPIKNEKYSDFLISLKTFVDPIEKVRNCVAHNRAIPQSIINDYETAKAKLLEELEQLFFFVDESSDDHGLFWEEEAYETIQRVLECANWNFDDGTVEISMDDCDRSQTCRSYDELVEALEKIADDTAFTYMPFDGGKPVFDYDSYSAIESVLPDYKEQLTELGWEY